MSTFDSLSARAKIGAELNKVRRGQLVLEYGKLKVIAPPAHRLEHTAKALIIGDVVTNQVGGTHGCSLTRWASHWFDQ
jgi:hypothetical protein